MGTFTYGQLGQGSVIDDRMLLHLQVVIVTKLRRGERFLFRCDMDEHIRSAESYWMSPDIPLRFAFDRPTAGLWLIPEPVDLSLDGAAHREPELARVGT